MHLKGQIREKWGQISDDELQKVQGNTEKLVGMIHERTGASRSEVEAFFDQAVKQGQDMLGKAAETARGIASDAGAAAQDSYNQAAETISSGYEAAEQAVRNNPVESLTAAFAVGILCGGLIGMMVRPSRS